MDDVQTRIEPSKFERDAMDLDGLQRRSSDAQVVFVLLRALARHAPASNPSTTVRTTARELDVAVTSALEALATPALSGAQAAASEFASALDALKRAVHNSLDAPVR